MAFDHNSVPRDLRPLNVARTVDDEPRIPLAATSSGFMPNLAQGNSPMYYPGPASEAGYVGVGYGNPVIPVRGVPTWGPRMPIVVGHRGVSPPVGVGISYGPNVESRVVGNFVDLPAAAGARACVCNPVVGNSVVNNGQAVSDMSTRFGYSTNLGSKGNVADQLSSDVLSGYAYNPNVGNRSDQASDDGGDASVSGKDIKLLCSFGGKILPRPSDGMLRYVGGHTRISSLRRDENFDELVRKMVDLCGQHMVIKYKLPDEDLDTLVSVSCADDLDNMKYEYEKLVERSPDGSAKLRMYLFPTSGIDTSGSVKFGDINDSALRYYVAVNGILDGVGSSGSMRRESTTSATSTHNFDYSTDAVDNSVLGLGDVAGTSTAGRSSSRGDKLSPKGGMTNSQDTGTRSDFSDPSPAVYEASSFPPDVNVVKRGPLQTSYSLPEVEFERSVPVAVSQQQPGLQQPGIDSQSTPYLQAYVSSHQLPPYMGFSNTHMYRVPGPVYTQHQFRDGSAGMTSHHFVPAVHMTMSPSSHVNVRPNVLQPMMQPQQTWLDHRYVDGSAAGHRVVQLPAEHSCNAYHDQVPAPAAGGAYGWHQVQPQEHVMYRDGLVSYQQVVYPERSHRLEDCFRCQKTLPHAHSDPVPIQGQRDSGASPLSDADSNFHGLLNKENWRSRPLNRVVVSGASGDGGVGQGVEIRPIVQRVVDPLIGKPHSDPTRIVQADYPMISAAEGVTRRAAPAQYQMEDFVNAPVNEEVRLTAALPVQTEDSYNQQLPQVSGRESPLENNLDSKQFIPNEVLSAYIPGSPQLHSTQPVEINETPKPMWEYPETYQQSRIELPVDSHSLQYGNPVVSTPLPNITQPAAEMRTEKNMRLQPTMIHTDVEVFTSNGNISSSFSAPVRTVDVQDSSNSPFSDQDPWNMRHDLHLPPPIPTKIQLKKDAYTNRDPFGGNGAELNRDLQLEDGGQQTLDNLKKNLGPDHAKSSKGSTEEQIKQDLQAVAEVVASSVFQSSSASNLDFSGENQSAYDSKQEDDQMKNSSMQQSIEDVRTKSPDKPNLGFPVVDGMGRLQIIKNDDLEELRELGSGTFGAVYHGMWRGTDVAIKRINERCFAGNSSEQERMRNDFWNEAINLADLHHPNVVAFYGVVLDGPGGSVATVTEYMVNGSLKRALQKNEKILDTRKRLLIAMDVAFGMEYLHGKNIVHFDLKSDNLLVNLRDPHRPICKVGDLGLSKVKCQTLISGGVRGTLPWMAPELLNGNSNLVSEKVDVFSFGIVLWELLTGEEPYGDLHYGTIIGGIVSNTLRPPIPESCDPEWKALMERCWSAEPSERLNFTEIANQLRAMAAKIPP